MPREKLSSKLTFSPKIFLLGGSGVSAHFIAQRWFPGKAGGSRAPSIPARAPGEMGQAPEPPPTAPERRGQRGRSCPKRLRTLRAPPAAALVRGSARPLSAPGIFSTNGGKEERGNHRVTGKNSTAPSGEVTGGFGSERCAVSQKGAPPRSARPTPPRTGLAACRRRRGRPPGLAMRMPPPPPAPPGRLQRGASRMACRCRAGAVPVPCRRGRRGPARGRGAGVAQCPRLISPAQRQFVLLHSRLRPQPVPSRR